MTYKEKYSWFYNTPEWKKLRKYKFNEADGLCEQCWKNGIVEQGIEVYHKVPIEKNKRTTKDVSKINMVYVKRKNKMV